MEKLEVFALDADRNRLTASIPYKSLDWHRCYYEPGDFTIEVPRSIYTPEWKYIYTEQREETGEIQKVEIRDGEHGWEDVVVLSGFFEEGILNRRCFLNQYEGGISSADNVQSVTGWLRSYLPSDFQVIDAGFEGVPKVLNPALSFLGDTAFAEMQTIGASIRIGYDFETNKRTAQVWRGVDRTQSQSGNPWAVFSETWGNLSQFSASVDTSNYRNKCYVLRDYFEPIAYDEDGDPHVFRFPDYNTETGETTYFYAVIFKRVTAPIVARLDDGIDENIECFLDERGNEPSFISEIPTDSKSDPSEFSFPPNVEQQYRMYEESLLQAGLDELVNNFPIERVLDSGVLDFGGYRRDYDLGDKIDASIDSIGLVMEARIIEADEVYDSNGFSVSLEFGDKKVRRIDGRR